LEKGTKNPLDTKQAELESYLRKPQKNLENRFNNRPVGFRKHSEEIGYAGEFTSSNAGISSLWVSLFYRKVKQVNLKQLSALKTIN